MSVTSTIPPGSSVPSPFTDLVEGTYPNPPADVARVFALDANGYTQVEMKDSVGHGVRFASDNVVIAKITEPAGVTRGQAVYIAGATGANSLVRLAKSDNIATMPAIGIVLDSGANNAFTRILTTGTLQLVNTSAFAEGVSLFVSPTVAGGYTDTFPAFPTYAQRVGFVTRSHATQGEILVLTTGVAADPRLHQATHQIGGVDELVNAAWTNRKNVFTKPQVIQFPIAAPDYPGVIINASSQPVDARVWRILNVGNLYLQATNDAETTAPGQVLIDRVGTLSASGNLIPLGGSVLFPSTQIAVNNPNALDDYEEGSWTPTMISDGGGAGISYNFQKGAYTKVGNIVHVDWDVGIIAATWNPGNLLIGGLPFVAANDVYVSGCVNYFVIAALGVSCLMPQVAPNGSGVYILYIGAGAGTVAGAVQQAHISSGDRILGSCTYRSPT